MHAQFHAEFVDGLPICRIEFPLGSTKDVIVRTAHSALLEMVPTIYNEAVFIRTEVNLDHTIDIVCFFVQLPPIDCPLMRLLLRNIEIVPKGN